MVYDQAMVRCNLIELLRFKQPPPPEPEASKLWLCDFCGQGVGVQGAGCRLQGAGCKV